MFVLGFTTGDCCTSVGLVRAPIGSCAPVADTNAHMRHCWQGDPARSASHGFFINLNAVLLRLCDPFLEPMSGKAWGKLDARHVPALLFEAYQSLTRGSGVMQGALLPEARALYCSLAAQQACWTMV